MKNLFLGKPFHALNFPGQHIICISRYKSFQLFYLYSFETTETKFFFFFPFLSEPGLTEVCYSTLALDYMQKTRPPHALWMYTPAYHKSQDYLLRCNQYLENEQSTPFAQPTDDAEDCVDPESHAADSECTTSDSQNRPECSARNISQNTCSCNNPSSDYVFFNPTQNEYLEK